MVFNFLEPFQGPCTVIAFLFILLSEYEKSKTDDKHEKEMKETDEQVTIILSKIERIKKYGQIKNAHAK